MTPDQTILVVGTYDTKQDELTYLADRIWAMSGENTAPRRAR